MIQNIHTPAFMDGPQGMSARSNKQNLNTNMKREGSNKMDKITVYHRL